MAGMGSGSSSRTKQPWGVLFGAILLCLGYRAEHSKGDSLLTQSQDPPSSGKGGRGKGRKMVPSRLTGVEFSCSVLLRAKEPAGTKGEE